MSQLLSACFLVLSCFQGMMLHAQRKWKGSVDNKWSNAANWQPAGIPGASDDVILDNAFILDNYHVILPDDSIIIQSLIIEPSGGKQIELLLPVSNQSSPALHVQGTGNVIVLRSGGILKNSSGINNGQSILLNGTIRIEDGGAYIHNSRSSHAAEIVAKLASGAGTEKGIFEFDVPGGAYPVSLSNRTFGKLVLSAMASGGAQTYNASGSNPLTIRDDFQMNDGVQLNIDFLGDFVVHGNFLQKGGVFNIASQPNNNVIHLKGNIEQAATAVITESSLGNPVLELNGNVSQSVLMEGNITNDITVRLNNPQGLELFHALRLPHNLELVSGIIKTTQHNHLVLSGQSKVTGSSALSYVDGPMKKLGDGDFEFPLGKKGQYAPVIVHGAKDGALTEVTAEYFKADPSIYFGVTTGKDISKLSSQEYWTITRSPNALPWKLSLPVTSYSNATGNTHPVIAWWDELSARWQDKGSFVHPEASKKSITSNELTSSGTFTLAGNIVNMQPLSINQVDFYAERQSKFIVFTWGIDPNAGATSFIIEKSDEETNFKYLTNVEATAGNSIYTYRLFRSTLGVKQFYRLKVMFPDGSELYSDIILVPGVKEYVGIPYIFPTIVLHSSTYVVQSLKEELAFISVTDMNGKTVMEVQRLVYPGSNKISLNFSDLPAGMYILQDRNKLMTRSVIIRFFKR